MLIDCCCRRCGKRYGWGGGLEQVPPCPRCGARPDLAGWEADARTIAGFREFLARRTKHRGGKRT